MKGGGGQVWRLGEGSEGQACQEITLNPGRISQSRLAGAERLDAISPS